MALLILLPLPVLYYIGVIIYRLYFHPLRHVPGPRLAAASFWYEFYFDIVRDGDLVFQLGRLHEKYGPVVRITPREVHVNDLTIYHEIYKQNTAYIKDSRFYRPISRTPPLLSIIDPTEHRQRRELFNPFFSKRAIYALEGLLWGKVDKFCQRITEFNGAPILMTDGFHCAMVDIISEYLFGRSFNMLNEPNFNGKHVRNMEMLVKGIPMAKHFPFMKDIALLLPDFLAAKAAPGFAHMFKISDTIVSDLLSKTKPDAPKDDSSQKPLISDGGVFKLKHKTIYDALLDQNGLDTKRKKPLSKLALIEESVIFLSAGTDTVSLSLTFAVFNVLNSPEVKGKLLQELAELKERCGETPPLRDLERLPYLTGVVKEGFRFGHGAPGKLPRVVPPSGTRVGNIHLPPGTIIGMSGYYISINPEFYPEPERFWPERWTLHPPPEKWFVPFSKGSRSCVGMNLAWANMYLTIAALFMRFDLQLYKTGPKDVEWRDYIVPFLKGHLRVVAAPKK